MKQDIQRTKLAARRKRQPTPDKTSQDRTRDAITFRRILDTAMRIRRKLNFRF